MRSSLDEVDCGREEEKEVHKVEEIGGEKGKSAENEENNAQFHYNCTATRFTLSHDCHA